MHVVGLVHGNLPQPRKDALALPGKAVEFLHRRREGVAQDIFGSRRITQFGHEYGRVERA